MCPISSETSLPCFVVTVVGECGQKLQCQLEETQKFAPGPLTPAVGWRRGPAGSQVSSRISHSRPQGTPLGPQPGTSFSHLPPGKIPAALPAPRHLSPPFPLLSVFQKRVEIPHLLTPSPRRPYCGFIPFLFLRHHIKGRKGR